MRHFAYRGLALAVVIAVSASGQQARSQSVADGLGPAIISVDLPIEPAHEALAPTIADAAALNDFPQFDQLYRAAAARGQAPVAWRELHTFWSWSLNDPTGAFYGRSTYDRLAGLYPAYAAYIAEFALVDSHGATFYPSAETRQFLFEQALSGSQPRVPSTEVATVAARPGPGRSKASVRVATASRPAKRATVPAEVAPVAVSVTVPLPVARIVEMPVRTPVETPAPQDHRLGEALLLTILGLLGVGVISLILNTPAEERPASRHSEA